MRGRRRVGDGPEGHPGNPGTGGRLRRPGTPPAGRGRAFPCETTGADVRYPLEQANHRLREPLVPEVVLGVYAGLRPLVDRPDRQKTQAISREHVVREVAVRGRPPGRGRW
ncbi:hypothetical protein [Streptosporangium roseum]|uniref:hypothetical protein n=1 Tax=Streptosporangium roseum TaxID=2001 RepID=UPI0011D26F35|nr:hypothetical protein [Streptosporangium roseum]